MNHELTEHISKRDLVELLTLGHRSLTYNDETGLKKLILTLKNLFYFENAFFCRCNPFELLKPHDHPQEIYVCEVNFPQGFMDLYFEGPEADHNPRVAKILEYMVPFLAEVCKRILKHTPKFLTELTQKEIEVLNWTKDCLLSLLGLSAGRSGPCPRKSWAWPTPTTTKALKRQLKRTNSPWGWPQGMKRSVFLKKAFQCGLFSSVLSNH